MKNKLELSKLSLEPMSAVEMNELTGGDSWQQIVAKLRKILKMPPPNKFPL